MFLQSYFCVPSASQARSASKRVCRGQSWCRAAEEGGSINSPLDQIKTPRLWPPTPLPQLPLLHDITAGRVWLPVGSAGGSHKPSSRQRNLPAVEALRDAEQCLLCSEELAFGRVRHVSACMVLLTCSRQSWNSAAEPAVLPETVAGH